MNDKFYTVGADKLAAIWDVKSGKSISKFYGHNNKINCCSLNEDENILVTGSEDGTAKIWDVKH